MKRNKYKINYFSGLKLYTILFSENISPMIKTLTWIFTLTAFVGIIISVLEIYYVYTQYCR